VVFRLGGRDTRKRCAGTFRRKRDAETRREWVEGELAAMRVPDLALLEPPAPRRLSEAWEEWRRSRIDVDAATAATYRTSQQRVVATLGDTPVETLTVADIARMVAQLHEGGIARESIRKTRAHLAMVLDFAGVAPNPARDRSVKLPKRGDEEMVPPLAAHVAATFYAIASKYRLPHLVYDCCGMRLRELEQLEWRDVDEVGRRWRVRKEVSKTRRPRWVRWDRFPNEEAGLVFDAVLRLVPREDRDPAARVFRFDGDAYRTELTRACKAAGVPVFTPNDLRHRRATLWHLGGVPSADAASWLGHSPNEHLRTYAHASLDERSEVAYAPLLFDLADGPITMPL
jgi:integrase